MKRIIALVLVFVLLGSVSFAEEILFRDIPWGASLSDVESYIAEIGYYSAYDEMCMSYWDEENMPPLAFVNSTVYPTGWQGYCYSGGELSVAGYQVDGIQVLCHYGLSDSGILRSKEDSVYYMAAYVLLATDIESAYTDLYEKLTGLYGNGVENTEYSEGFTYYEDKKIDYDVTEKEAVWYGDNNTSVRLEASYSSLGPEDYFHNSLMIYYGKTDHDATLDEIDDAVERELILGEAENRTDDVSGL